MVDMSLPCPWHDSCNTEFRAGTVELHFGYNNSSKTPPYLDKPPRRFAKYPDLFGRLHAK